MFETPILFLIFNRPEPTQQVFEKIRAVRPKKLFVAADGPRPGKAGEAALCQAARAVLNQVDWPCEVHTLLHNENLGCGKAVSGAITWFFNEVEQGIILEDDCLPDQSFFPFCETLLNYYRDNDRVMHIGGTNSQFGRKRNAYSYYFSKYPHIWGWATWRRAWSHFQYDLGQEDTETVCRDIFSQYKFSVEEQNYWTHSFDVMKQGGLDTWDIQWTFACWKHHGITIVPNINLISNIGFDEQATHTKFRNSRLARVPTGSAGPLLHPKRIDVDVAADAYTFRNYNLHRPAFYVRLRQWIASLLPQGVKDKIKRVWQ